MVTENSERFRFYLPNKTCSLLKISSAWQHENGVRFMYMSFVPDASIATVASLQLFEAFELFPWRKVCDLDWFFPFQCVGSHQGHQKFFRHGFRRWAWWKCFDDLVIVSGGCFVVLRGAAAASSWWSGRCSVGEHRAIVVWYVAGELRSP